MSNNVGSVPLYDMLQQLKTEVLKDLRVNLPGSIEAVNSDGTVDVKIGVMQNISKLGLPAGLDFNYPVLQGCVLLTPQGGGVGFIAPIKKGDECFVSFSDRCIDAWFSTGQANPLPSFRMHDISDGFAFVGPNSSANKITPSASTGEGGICETKTNAGARVLINPNTHLIKVANGTKNLEQILQTLIIGILGLTSSGNPVVDTTGQIAIAAADLIQLLY